MNAPDLPLNSVAAAGKPVVLVPACNKQLGLHPYHIVGRKYIDAVRLAGALPLAVPGTDEADLDALLDLADGLLLTGSPSNVDPSYYGEAVHNPALPLDPARDAVTLPLIRKVVARGMPLLGICRGTQETNVALGGSLHQAVHEIEGNRDHRSDDDDPVDVQYGPVHDVIVQPGGVLERIAAPRFAVNSLHGQAVNRLAPGLRVEALAPDGVVEAYSVASAAGFTLCLQWHPEWQAAQNPTSMAILRAFGDACRQYRNDKAAAVQPRTRNAVP